MIRDHIAGSAAIEVEDFDTIPFHQWGGRIKAYSLFGNELPTILNETERGADLSAGMNRIVSFL